LTHHLCHELSCDRGLSRRHPRAAALGDIDD
jgi:hypothetical protein